MIWIELDRCSSSRTVYITTDPTAAAEVVRLRRPRCCSTGRVDVNVDAHGRVEAGLVSEQVQDALVGSSRTGLAVAGECTHSELPGARSGG